MSARTKHFMLPRAACMAGSLTEIDESAAQRFSSHMTITSRTRITSTRVTRDFGNAIRPVRFRAGAHRSPGSPCRTRRSTRMARARVPRRAGRPGRGQPQRHRYHDDCLQHEAQAGQPQFDAVPPIEEPGHPVRVCARAGCTSMPSMPRLPRAGSGLHHMRDRRWRSRRHGAWACCWPGAAFPSW